MGPHRPEPTGIKVKHYTVAGDYENLGDVSTLADPRVVEDLVKERKAH
ncbi:hypothetical protein [Trinickia symbiotica]|nr:hypothetical protein [Trinickia symbiotica]